MKGYLILGNPFTKLAEEPVILARFRAEIGPVIRPSDTTERRSARLERAGPPVT